MTVPTYASWVKPLAEETAGGAEALLAFARSQPNEFWDRPSAIDGWTCKDVLAHLAGDTGKVSLRAMRAAADGTPFADPPDFKDGGDGLNARDAAERRERSVQELITEIERDRQEWADLMTRLTDDDDGARWPGFPLSLGQYLRLCASHDRQHLEHLRHAPEGQR